VKKIKVEICVCTQCVMNGAMDIIESIEGMQKLKTQIKMNTQIEIATNKHIGEGKHSDKSPIVKVNGEIIENADSQIVMSKILKMTA